MDVILTWKELARHKKMRWAIAFCIMGLLIMVFYLPSYYGEVIEPKPGIYLDDFILNLFTPVNWSVLIFTLIYLSLAETIISVARNPTLILLGLSTYFAVSLLRMGTMYLLTLETPTDMILLVDPVSANFYPDSTFAKDLFFSGHVSTMTLLVLVEKKEWIKWVKAVFTLAIGILLAWQHVHYTIDLVVAPVVTILVFYAFKNIFGPDLNV